MGATSMSDNNAETSTSSIGTETKDPHPQSLLDEPPTMEPMMISDAEGEVLVPLTVKDGGSCLSKVKSLHQSKHLLDQDLEELNPSGTTETPMCSSSADDSLKERKLKACDLARKIFLKGVEESRSRLLDMTDNFPHFNESEIVFGVVLGKGCFGTVSEVRGFNLREQALRRRSFDLTRSGVADEEVPPGDMESRRFMATHAFRNEGHARYAIKKLSSDIIENPSDLVQGMADLVSEAKILSAIEHPNIIKLRAIKAGNRFRPDFFIVMDRLYETLGQRIEVWRQQVKGGNNIFSRLLAFRHTRIKKACSYQDRVVQAYHLSSALNYLHRQNLIHRDLKPENIGFDVRGDIKIFDFGMAKEMPDRNPATSTATYKFTGMCGSPRYMAPEVAHKQKYNEKCDVYSFSVLFYEILSLQSAFGHHHDFRSMFACVWGPPYMRPNLTKLKLPETIYRVIYGGWHYDFTKRPSMQVVEDTLQEECKTFPNVTLPTLTHRRRKSKVIYDKEKQVFRVNSMLFEGKLKEYQVAASDSLVQQQPCNYY